MPFSTLCTVSSVLVQNPQGAPPPPPPSSISITSVTKSGSSFIINFTGGSGATSFTAQVYNGASLIATNSGSISPITVSTISSNTNYNVYVVGTNTGGSTTSPLYTANYTVILNPYFNNPNPGTNNTLFPNAGNGNNFEASWYISTYTNANWRFINGAQGVAPTAYPSGSFNYNAFVQMPVTGTTAYISQVLTFNVLGTYTVSFWGAPRPSYYTTSNSINCTIDGTVVISSQTFYGGQAWSQFTGTYNCTTTGTKTLYINLVQTANTDSSINFTLVNISI
jgi:hypothetical protein